jgi:LysR family transcriptional activator of nhaA
MRHLNYNHLLYFWTVARHNSVARAADELHVTPQTISGQLRLLEDTVGEPLFDRVGRGLVLTDTGRLVKQYADEIFALGGELSQRVRSGSLGAALTLTIGIVDSIPKLIAYRLIRPALTLDMTLRIVCREGGLEEQLADLAVHKLDLVISDRPPPPATHVKAYTHPLGGSTLAFFAHPDMARDYREAFPRSLDGAPMLLPAESSAIRHELDNWLADQDIAPRVVAEFDDSALLKAFGEAGLGVFPAPAAIAADIERKYGVQQIGTVTSIIEPYFAISTDRKLDNPAIRAITDAARDTLPEEGPRRRGAGRRVAIHR